MDEKMRGIENEQDNAIVRIEKCSRCSRKGGRGAQKERCYERKLSVSGKEEVLPGGAAKERNDFGKY